MPEFLSTIAFSTIIAALAISGFIWVGIARLNGRRTKQFLRQAHTQLDQAEAEQRSLLAAMTDIVLVLSRDGEYLKVPSTAAKWLYAPREELLGRNVRDVLTPQDADGVCRVIQAALAPTAPGKACEPVAHEYSLQFPGQTLLFSAMVTRLNDDSVLWVARDITAERSLQQQLSQSQKMEAVGLLAGGIAHDFNNILTAILGHSDFLLDAIHPSDPRYDDVLEIRTSARRAESLTRQLLAFSRKQILNPVVLNLDATIAQTQTMLGRVIGEDITVVTRLNARGSVLVDPTQMEQVLVNLSVNARDAMPKGGTLTLATSNVEVPGDSPLGIPMGEYIRISVTDNGCGMPAEVQAHIFEPFYTTKEAGRGTGLGLSTVHGIVTQSGGFMLVRSIIGVGSTFEIMLPRELEESSCASAATHAKRLSPRGSETVLLVEDEPSVRALAGRILKKHGYVVLEAPNGRVALEVADLHDHYIDLLLTDVVMPEMGAADLVREMRQRRPTTKVLLMSGYTEDEIIRRDVSARAGLLLQKPFTNDELAYAVRKALDEAAPACAN